MLLLLSVNHVGRLRLPSLLHMLLLLCLLWMLSWVVWVLIELLGVRVASLGLSSHVRCSVVVLHHLGVMGRGCRVWRRSLMEMADMRVVPLGSVISWLAIVIVIGGVLLRLWA